MSAAVLEIDGLTTGYEDAAVVRELDLSVGEGEVVALMGANGAGKTTTLRAVSGIVHPMAGGIAFGGRDLAGTSISGRARLGIAHVPENRGLIAIARATPTSLRCPWDRSVGISSAAQSSSTRSRLRWIASSSREATVRFSRMLRSSNSSVLCQVRDRPRRARTCGARPARS